MLRDILIILTRELKLIFSKKSTAFGLFLLPFLLLGYYGYLYCSQTVDNLHLAIINESPSQESRYLVNSFARREQFIVEDYLSQDEAIAALEKGEIQGIVIIPADFTQKLKNGQTADVVVIANGSNIVLSNNIMTGSAEIVQGYSKILAAKRFEKKGYSSTTAQSTAAPIHFNYRPWYNPVNSYPIFLIPGLITVLIQQITFLYTAISITEERKRGSLKVLFDDEIKPLAIILGKMLVYSSCVFLSCAGCFIMARYIVHVPLRGSFLELFDLSSVFLGCISAIGIFLSIICRNSLEATQYSMLIALPSFLLSGYTWPTQAMPEFCVYLSKILPLTYYAIPVRDIMLMGLSLAKFKKEIIILGLMAVIFIIMGTLVLTLRKGSGSHKKPQAALP
ncbi:MAG: ABC transporter permease [Clostridia bacterium]|nr:ABC transporter permease [Clostridia bacterium]